MTTKQLVHDKKSVKKQRKLMGFDNYVLYPIPKDITTFGTSLWIRDDGLGLIVQFPTGAKVVFEPLTTKQ